MSVRELLKKQKEIRVVNKKKFSILSKPSREADIPNKVSKRK